MRNCFSLIELLVVIAVISILASLLLPALNAARESAYSTQCASQMKQIGLSFSQYLGESDDVFPTVYLYSTKENWAKTLSENRYLDLRIVPCPSARNAEYDKLRYRRPFYNWEFLPCGMNWSFNGGVRQNRIRNVSSKVLVAESVGCSNFEPTLESLGHVRISRQRESSGFGVPFARHRNLHGCNVLWSDCHVTSVVAPTIGAGASDYFYAIPMDTDKNWDPED